MAIVDPPLFEALRLGFTRATPPRSRMPSAIGWLLLAGMACAGGYAAGREQEVAPAAADCDRETRTRDEQIMALQMALTDCKIFCGRKD